MENEVTIRSTKAEIFEALNAALAKADAAEKRRLNPEKQEREKEEKKTVASAVKAVEENIFSNELIHKFKDLQSAIKIEEERLNELYGIGAELQKIALAIEAGRDKIAEIENERLSKAEAAQAELGKLRDDYAKTKADLQTDYDAHAKKIKTERDREAEEFKYNLERKREKENNAWADEKAVREAALEKKEIQAAALLSDAELKTDFIKSLEEKVNTIPNQINAEKESAVKTVTDELNREHQHQFELAEMERKNAVARLEDKVKYLEKELAAESKANETLQSKLDRAYSEIRELATKTVESATGIKVIGGSEKSGI